MFEILWISWSAPGLNYLTDSNIGRLDRGLDEAQARGWTVVDMKADWNRVFGYEKQLPTRQ